MSRIHEAVKESRAGAGGTGRSIPACYAAAVAAEPLLCLRLKRSPRRGQGVPD